MTMTLDLYLRLSDLRLEDMNKDGESTGLAYGEKQLRSYAERIGAHVGEAIVENDIVDGKPKPASAYKRRTVILPDGRRIQRVIRPGFQRILERIETRKSDGFVTVDLDRAMRDPRDLEDLIDIVEATRANVRSLTGSLQFTNGGTDSEFTTARIMVTMANKASRDTARRVATARARQAEKGEWGGGKRPFGFEPDGTSVRQEEADEIKKAARGVLAGLSLRALAQDLRTRQVATVTGAPWLPGTLKDILLRPRNAGILVYRGEELTGLKAPWEPILPLDEYRAVVAKLAVRKAKPGRASRWLGSGIYLCACGGPVAAHAQVNRAPRYRCKDTGLGAGQHSARKVEALDGYVVDLVVEWCSRPEAVNRLIPLGVDVIDVDSLRTQAVALNERLTEKVRSNFHGEITDEQLVEFTRLTKLRLSEIDRDLAKAVVASPLSDLVESGTGDDEEHRRQTVRAKWDSFSLGLQRQILRELLTVQLLPTTSSHTFDPRSVNIKWNL